MKPVPAHAEPITTVPAPAVAIGEVPDMVEMLPDASPPAAADGGLGKRAAMGFVLMSGQSILTRVLSLGAQVVLARLLTQEQFGLFGLAMSIVNYANLSQQVGVREILVARHKRIDLWQSTGFWVATATGLLSMLLIFAAAPIAGWFYADKTLVWMLLILGLAQPTYNMTLVQEAKLQIHLRFKYTALCQFVWGALTPLLQLALALMKFGVFAFVVPRLLAGLIRWWMFQHAEPTRISPKWNIRRWKYILVPGMMVLLTALAYTIGPTVPSLMLGRYVGKAATGYFTFAYNLSLQVLMLLSMQIDSVLFPTLGKMQGDPQRQRAAMLRASRALTTIMAPACFLQMAASGPLVALMFGSKWQPAVEPLQIMSVGMYSAGAYITGQSLLQAQQRFRDKLVIALRWALISAAVSIAAILLVPAQDAVSAASIGLAIGYLGYGFDNYVEAIKPIGGGFRDAIRVTLMPTIVGTLSTTLAWFIGTLVAPLITHNLPQLSRPWMLRVAELGTIGIVGMLAYIILLRVLAPALWRDLMAAGSPIISRLRRAIPFLPPEKAT